MLFFCFLEQLKLFNEEKLRRTDANTIFVSQFRSYRLTKVQRIVKNILSFLKEYHGQLM